MPRAARKRRQTGSCGSRRCRAAAPRAGSFKTRSRCRGDAVKPRVFVTQKLVGDALERLAPEVTLDVWQGPGAPSPEQLRARARDCEGLLCTLVDRIDRTLLDACPRLRAVASCSVGL